MKKNNFDTSKVIDIYLKYLDLYRKAFIFFMGLQGLLMKFAFDTLSTIMLRQLISVMACFFCVLWYICICFAQVAIKKLDKIFVRENHSDHSILIFGGRKASFVFFIVTTLTLGFWLYILVLL